MIKFTIGVGYTVKENSILYSDRTRLIIEAYCLHELTLKLPFHSQLINFLKKWFEKQAYIIS